MKIFKKPKLINKSKLFNFWSDHNIFDIMRQVKNPVAKFFADKKNEKYKKSGAWNNE